MVQINVLGPLTISVNGERVTLTAPKPRRVLALLATSANSVVRNEQIIEELWETKPPVSVTTTLQTYVYQLRKYLHLNASQPSACAPDGRRLGGALHTFAGGYMLSLGPDALDSLQFERLAQRGRAQLEAGRVAEAAETLRAALALWRGAALVDVNPGPILQVEVLRLEETRNSTLEARIEADLRLGRHHELLSELVRIVAQQPTHEGFQGKLMLALYRAGRRSGALHAYQQARRALVKELGVEPSSELQRLHRIILAGDPCPGVTRTGPGPQQPGAERLPEVRTNGEARPTPGTAGAEPVAPQGADPVPAPPSHRTQPPAQPAEPASRRAEPEPPRVQPAPARTTPRPPRTQAVPHRAAPASRRTQASPHRAQPVPALVRWQSQRRPKP
ncbi:MAG TPA: BTAD domain-containing putative transcriptional regulator [Micromonosporaceae bacterium]|nr:BTAD domain-containing putative transcriptional regulator [Micromonosporaceae bacterium]